MSIFHRLGQYRIAVTSSLWFIPSLCVLFALLLAVALTVVDGQLGSSWRANHSILFGVGAEGSRGMLAAIAGSMMTVASLTFSLTISTLATASSQYTSRLIRNFMRDRLNQFVLGYFVGLFGYCLVVLRSIRGGDEGQFVPGLAVLTGLALALASIGVLIVFIHHIAESIQASVILQRVTDETARSIENLFPSDVAEPAKGQAAIPDTWDDPHAQWRAVAAGRSGYVQNVDADSLVKWAAERGTVLRMEAGVGQFVTPGAPLISVTQNAAPDAKTCCALRGAYSVGGARTVEQDPAFGIRQVVDIALKALSPGINDTTTGVMCVEHLSVLLELLVGRPVPDRFRADDGTVRLIAKGRSFETLLNLMIDQIRQAADGNPAVLSALLQALTNAGRLANDQSRRAALLHKVRVVAATANESLKVDDDRDAVRVPLTAACLLLSPIELILPHTLLPAAGKTISAD